MEDMIRSTLLLLFTDFLKKMKKWLADLSILHLCIFWQKNAKCIPFKRFSKNIVSRLIHNYFFTTKLIITRHVISSSHISFFMNCQQSILTNHPISRKALMKVSKWQVQQVIFPVYIYTTLLIRWLYCILISHPHHREGLLDFPINKLPLFARYSAARAKSCKNVFIYLIVFGK